MNTRIFSKLTFLAAAVLINGLMFAGMNYLFDGQHERIALLRQNISDSTLPERLRGAS